MHHTKENQEESATRRALQTLQKLGLDQRGTLRSECRWYAGDAERARVAPKEAGRSEAGKSILVGAAPVVALRRETRRSPRFVAVTDPVGRGTVESLAAAGRQRQRDSGGGGLLRVLGRTKLLDPGADSAAVRRTPSIHRVNSRCSALSRADRCDCATIGRCLSKTTVAMRGNRVGRLTAMAANRIEASSLPSRLISRAQQTDRRNVARHGFFHAFIPSAVCRDGGLMSYSGRCRGPLPARGELCGWHLRGGAAARLRAATDEIRTRHQPEDRAAMGMSAGQICSRRDDAVIE